MSDYMIEMNLLWCETNENESNEAMVPNSEGPLEWKRWYQTLMRMIERKTVLGTFPPLSK